MTPGRIVRGVALAVTMGGFAAGIGCSAPSEEDTIGEAQIAITNVPADGSVRCVQITATGNATVVKKQDVLPGQSSTFHLTGLPTGSVAFTGDAFPSICNVVSGSTVPSWISDPVVASVSVSPPVNVTLFMHRNGGAQVGVDFPDENACRSSGAPCIQGAECCTGVCASGTCQGSCSSNGAACADATQCCAGQCQAGQCCTPLGNSCGTNADCCSGACNGGQCADAPIQQCLCGNGTCEPACGEGPASCPIDCGGGGGCLTPADCPSSPSECAAATCTAGVCGLVFLPAGTPTAAQTPGDCKAVVCDGTGNFVSVVDDSDIPNDGNQCTFDICQAGTPVQIVAPFGSACNQNGGHVCSSFGACVECNSDFECAGGSVCVGNTCQGGSSCVDTLENGSETDIDCGGSCAPCADGKTCIIGADCVSSVCMGNVCQSATCSDGVKNGPEPDVDCGGLVCPLCPPGKLCVANADCMSFFCLNGHCQ